MKKIYAYLGIALAATLSLSNCTKQIEAPVTPEQDGTPFEVSALLTKTTNDGYETKWAAADGINIFHAENGATSYTSDNEFTLSDAATGTFKGTLTGTLDGSKTYDWYAFYPYSSYNKTPAGVDNATFGYTTVGGTTQTQTGNNSTAHLCGKACPLYGVTTGVAASDVPAFTMKNLTSVICVEVTNGGTEALTVSSIAFTSTEDIVGTYYINFTGATPVYTATGASYVSSTAKLTVSGGAAIAAGGSAKFYIAIKPHTVASGSTLKLSVNGYEKSTTVSKDTNFEAGKIKTVKFNYNATPYVTLPWSIDGSGGSATWSSTPGLSENGLGSDYAASHSPYLAKMDGNGDYVQVRFDSPAKSVSFGVKMAGGKNTSTMTLTGSSDGTTFTDIEAFTISGKQNDIKSFTSSAAINTAYRYIRLVFTKGSNVGLGKVSISKDSTDPQIEAENVLGVSARGVTGQTLTYTLTNPVAGTDLTASCDGSIVTSATVTPGTVTYSVAQNTSGYARDGRITLTYGALVKEVKVSQLAHSFKTSVAEIELDAAISSTKTFTVTSDFDWIATSHSATKFTFTPESYTWTGDGKATVTVTASEANAAETGTATLGKISISCASTGETMEVIVKQKSSYVAPTTGTTVTKTISEIVTEKGYTVSTGTTIGTIMKSLEIDGVITLSSTGGGDTGSFWESGAEWRCYQTGATDPVIKVAATDGYVIEKLKLTFSVKNNGTLTNGSTSISSGAEYTVDAQSISYTIGCSTAGKTNGQIKLTAISVTYKKQ